MNSLRSKRIFAVLSTVVLLFAFCIPALAAENTSVAKETSVSGVTELIPGGMAFGVKFFTKGAIVLGSTGVETAQGVISPAKDAGIKSGDIIIRAGGEEFDSASELVNLISGCGGKPIAIAYQRDGEEYNCTVTPVRDVESGEYKIGVFVRDSTAGIGTVTYIDPETLDFGGLGHGIYDSETGMLLPLGRGAVVDVNVNGIKKSETNSPGELHGEFGTAVKGELWDNSEQGVFGRFNSMPNLPMGAIPVADRSELSVGKAYIITTLEGSEPKEYEIEIEHIYAASGDTKNFLIKVTDNDLISKTGGIVQGMSGSPIIKDGKLIGAVTHVLVNDPLRGYGICIENMLKSAYGVSTCESCNSIAA